MTNPAQLQLGIANRPYPGQEKSGDWPFFYTRDDDLLIGLVDSLGHGKAAHAGSMQIKGHLDTHWHTDLSRLLNEIDTNLKGGLGAAICVAHVTLSTGRLQCLGIGNVNAWVLGASDVRFVNRDGVIGQHYRTPVLQETQLTRGDKVIFASDGIQERLSTQCDRAELSRDPESLATYLLRHFGKTHDDASCLVFEF